MPSNRCNLPGRRNVYKNQCLKEALVILQLAKYFCPKCHLQSENSSVSCTNVLLDIFFPLSFLLPGWLHPYWTLLSNDLKLASQTIFFFFQITALACSSFFIATCSSFFNSAISSNKLLDLDDTSVWCNRITNFCEFCKLVCDLKFLCFYCIFSELVLTHKSCKELLSCLLSSERHTDANVRKRLKKILFMTPLEEVIHFVSFMRTWNTAIFWHLPKFLSVQNLSFSTSL